MKIKRLELLNFGKFHDTTIEFQDGLNIIEGSNESGKTTIYRFIEGVFFGFVKPFLKTTRFEKEYEQYRPWEGNAYDGAIILEVNGEEIRIFRDFMNKTYTIYEEKSGKNIGPTLPGYEISNLSFPGEYYFKCSSNVFRNTFLIGQRNTEVDPSSVKEIGDGLVATDFEVDNYSCEKALQTLLEQKNNIGTDRAYTKPYGQLTKQIEQLHSELEKLQVYDKKYFETLDELEKEKEKLTYLKNNQKALEWKERNQEIISLQKRKKERDELRNKLREVEQQLRGIEPVTRINANKLKNFYHELDIAREELHQLTKEKKNIYHNKASYGKLLQELKQINQKQEELESQEIVMVSKKQKVHRARLGGGIIVLLIIFLSVVDIFVLQGENIAYLIVLGAIVFGIGYFFYSGQIKELNQSMQKLQELRSALETMEKKRIFVSNDFDMGEIEKKFEDQAFELEMVDEKIDEAIAKEEGKKAEIQKELEHIGLTDFNFDDYDQQIMQWKVLQERKENLVENLKQFAKYDFSAENLILEKITDLTEYPIDDKAFLEQKLQEVLSTISKLDERLDGLEKYVSEKTETQEALKDAKCQLEKYDKHLQAIQLAIQTLNIAKNKLHKNFIPRITSGINKNMQNMTKSNRQFVMDENFNISILYENSSDFKLSDTLSQGTKDQLNISLRLAILEGMYSENYFIIFDDALTQYDDYRIVHQLMSFAKWTDRLQFLIFTCQVREKEIVDQLSIPHHYVRLE